MKRHARLCLASAALCLGCGEVTFTELTPPPPGAVATLEQEEKLIQVSRGVAFAIECKDPKYYACSNMEVSAADDSIVTAQVGYYDAASDSYYNPDTTRTIFIVGGRAEGETSLDVRTSDGKTSFRVQVLPN